MDYKKHTLEALNAYLNHTPLTWSEPITPEEWSAFFDLASRHDIDGVTVWSMGPMDHFLYLIFHAFKHFVHSGFGIRQVCDIVVYGSTYWREIDWRYVLACCRVLRSLFPPRKELVNRYPWLRKRPVLLPAAWGARIVTYGLESLGRRDNNVRISSKSMEWACYHIHNCNYISWLFGRYVKLYDCVGKENCSRLFTDVKPNSIYHCIL